MTEHTMATDPERLAAHERLSTGGLARWMRWCANHPWRSSSAGSAIIAGLIVLVATVGGSLKDEFEIPGSDTQRATDLIEAEFASEQGSVLNLVFAAPEGERLDTPERKAAIEDAVAKLKTSEFAPSGDEVGVDSVGDPFCEADLLRGRAHRVHGGAVLGRHRDRRTDRGSSPFRTPCGRRSSRAGVIVEFNGDAEFPPIEQGTQELLGFLAAFIVLLHRLPDVRRDVDPDRPRARRRRNRVHPALHPRRADDHQHDHAHPRVDDRDRRRHRLLAVHRHPVPTVPPRGSATVRRGGRGRRVGGASGHLRRSHRRDLGHRSRLLRPRLRDEARDRRRARRADDGAHRELAAHRRAGEARAQDRPSQGSVPQADRRLRGRTRPDADRALGPVRDGPREAGVLDPARGRPRARCGLGARPARCVRPGDAADRADGATRVRPARGGLRAGLQRPDPDRRRRQRRRAGAAARVRGRPGARRARRRRLGRRAAVQRLEVGRDRVRHSRLGAAGRGDGGSRPPSPGRRGAGRDGRQSGARSTCPV